MTRTVPSSANELSWQERHREAHLLAGLLRMSRLTLLYGEPGSGKTTLLRSGVMPLLRRRAIDRLVERPKQGRVVVPFPDRRGQGRLTDSGAEVAFYFDAWDRPPLPALQARIAQILSASGATFSAPGLSLTDTIALGTKSLGACFLFIFDHFEQYLSAPPQREGITEFADEFIRVASQPFLAANFLISVRDEAEPAMTRFRARISDYEDACLRLPPLRRPAATPLGRQLDFDVTEMLPAMAPALTPSASDSANAQRDTEASASEPKEMFERLDWSRPRGAREPRGGMAKAADAGPASIDTGIEEAPAAETMASAKPPWPEPISPGHREPEPSGDERREPEPSGKERHEPKPSGREPQPEPPPLVIPPDLARGPEGPAGVQRNVSLPLLIGLAACIAASVLALLLWPSTETSKQSLSPPAPAVVPPQPAPAPVAAPALIPTPAPAVPELKIVADATNSIDAAVARDIARLVAPNSGLTLDVVPASNWAGSLAGLRNQPSVAIAHHDALRAARNSPAAGKAIANLRIVMPLFAEEIYFITPSRSPLDYVHEIEGKKINIGPAQGSRALTAATIYERMFGAPMPVSEGTNLDEKEALQHLLTDKTIDVIVLVGTPPAALLAGMTPDVAHSIKILELNRNEPESRRALEAYLPATVPSMTAAEKVSTLAVMSFLVTFATDDPGSVERLGRFARSLCTNLPALQREGNRKWRDVQPGMQLSADWPYSTAAAETFRTCRQSTPEIATPARSTVLSR